MSKPVLVPDPEFLECAILSFVHHGDRKMLAMIATTRKELLANRTRFERLFEEKPIGGNFAILQFETVLAKVGLEDSR